MRGVSPRLRALWRRTCSWVRSHRRTVRLKALVEELRTTFGVATLLRGEVRDRGDMADLREPTNASRSHRRCSSDSGNRWFERVLGFSARAVTRLGGGFAVPRLEGVHSSWIAGRV